MNEIERIIVEVRKKYHEKVLWKDGSNYVPTRNCLVEIELEAEAISQYVIKARIEGAEHIYRSDITTEDYIAQLKKGLK